ncbi:hypothetical protein VTJ83DRAFT_138 [Remersonia thermophila]|uniref:Copper acquisition factor BIM1-like domain-containing protein n=1 Tax=Remersonia thermophila TaxID=72144 RepID=A0ABR4DM56_9PEZI
MFLSSTLLLAAAGVANAHFGLDYPPMRANTLGRNVDPAYSQWTQPCAGVPGNLTDSPRTEWPLTGGSIKLDLRHHWTYIFINLGLGSDVSNFNYTLTNPFWNSTGNGTLCIEKLALPADLPVEDGSPASLQVVTLGDNGNALYNCANIVFKADAKPLEGDACKSVGVTYAPIEASASSGHGSHGSDDDENNDDDDDDDNSTGTPSAGSTAGNAGAATGVNRVALSSAVALAVVFVFGMSA